MAALILPLLLLLSVFAPSRSHCAQTDSVNTGIRLIEEFHHESAIILKDRGFEKEAESLKRSSSADRNRAKEELESIERTAAPGVNRYEKVRDIVAGYFDRVIDNAASMENTVQNTDQEIFKKGLEEIKRIKTEKIARLHESLESESFSRREPQPVPLIDSSPFETSPDDAPGIWYR